MAACPSLASVPATLPTPMDDDHALEVVETPEQLEALAEHLKECEFAADLEHHSSVVKVYVFDANQYRRSSSTSWRCGRECATPSDARSRIRTRSR